MEKGEMDEGKWTRGEVEEGENGKWMSGSERGEKWTRGKVEKGEKWMGEVDYGKLTRGEVKMLNTGLECSPVLPSLSFSLCLTQVCDHVLTRL